MLDPRPGQEPPANRRMDSRGTTAATSPASTASGAQSPTALGGGRGAHVHMHEHGDGRAHETHEHVHEHADGTVHEHPHLHAHDHHDHHQDDLLRATGGAAPHSHEHLHSHNHLHTYRAGQPTDSRLAASDERSTWKMDGQEPLPSGRPVSGSAQYANAPKPQSPVMTVTPQTVGHRSLFDTRDVDALEFGVPQKADAARPTPDDSIELAPAMFHEGGHQPIVSGSEDLDRERIDVEAAGPAAQLYASKMPAPSNPIVGARKTPFASSAPTSSGGGTVSGRMATPTVTRADLATWTLAGGQPGQAFVPGGHPMGSASEHQHVQEGCALCRAWSAGARAGALRAIQIAERRYLQRQKRGQ
jgi:hypothetical protein